LSIGRLTVSLKADRTTAMTMTAWQMLQGRNQTTARPHDDRTAL